MRRLPSLLDPSAKRPRSDRRNQRIVIGLATLAGLAIVFLFLRLVNLPSVLRHLEHLNLRLALLCGAVFLSAYVVRALRWRCLLAPEKVGIGRIVAIYQVAIFVNWLLPLRGGELVKGITLRRLNGIPLSRSLPTVAMDKFMDLLPIVVVVLALPFLHLKLSDPLVVFLGTLSVIFSFGVLVLVLGALQRSAALALLSWLTATLPRRIRVRTEPFLIRFLDVTLELVAQPRLLLQASLYTAVAVLLDGLYCFLAFAAVGAQLSFPAILFGYTFYNLGYILPTPPGQIGSNELVGLLVFTGLLHIDPSEVGAMFLFSHPWSALLMASSGLFCLSTLGLSLRGALSLSNPDSNQLVSETE